METRLLDLLVCPLCKGPLQHVRPPLDVRHELICRADRLAYPVRDGIPVMLESEARLLDDDDSAGSAATPLGIVPAAAVEPSDPPDATP